MRQSFLSVWSLLLCLACADGDPKSTSETGGAGGDASATGDDDGGDVGDGGEGGDGGDGGDGADGSDGTDCSDIELVDGSCVSETFANPPVLAPDADGVHTLTFGPAEVELDGRRHCVRAYNGGYPGPTIEVEARGSDARQLRVDIVNAFTSADTRSLEGQDCTCTDMEGAECVPGHGHGGEGHCSCVDAEGEECVHVYDFNTTNLHFHGAHVEPDFANGGGCVAEPGLACRECDAEDDADPTNDTCFFADDVISAVPPGDGHQHRYDIDEDHTHHEGTNWYHPHIHGTTAIQVGSGAAGAILMRGPVDEVPAIAAARERVMVFSTPPSSSDAGFAPLEDGVECTEDTLTFNDFSVLGNGLAAQLNVVNGQRQPRMITPPGQLERWRFIHAGFLDEVFLGVFKGRDTSCDAWGIGPDDTLSTVQFSRDGITLPALYESDMWFMSPGYRIDLLLGGADLVDGDTWCLVSGRFLQDTEGGTPTSPGAIPSAEEVRELFADGDVVAILNVDADAGEATGTALPTEAEVAAHAPSTTLGGVSATDRCAAAAAVDDPAEIDQVSILQVGVFTADDPDPCGCDNYNVNCKNFGETDRERYPVDRDLPLGEVEQWRVGASVDGHPFHIHINPFLVCPEDNPFDPLPFAHWRDTVLVNLNRKVDLVTQYSAHTGTFVFHCHKLTHEDEGMMQIVRTCDPDDDGTCGDHDWRACDTDDLECIQHLAATDCAAAAVTEVDAAACITALGGPLGVCGPNACLDSSTCTRPGEGCVDNVCQPL